MNSVLVHRSTDSKTPSCLLALPIHKEIPLTEEIAQSESIDVLNWLAETLPSMVYERVIERLKSK